MYNDDMYALGSARSVIRELYEYGKKMSAELGADKVFDFTLGNPSVPTPSTVNDVIIDLAEHDPSIHAYTSAQGNLSVRKAISDYITAAYSAKMSPDLIYMTSGAAAALTITLKAIVSSAEDKVLAIAPFFPEYRVFANAAGAKFNYATMDRRTFGIDFDDLESKITEDTVAVIVNSPNNPSGVVYDESDIRRLTDILMAKQRQYGKSIILISDEPYREIVFDSAKVPYIMNYYDNTVVCYSYSKSLSLPGERIGYIAISPLLDNADRLYAAVCGAGRALGYVCASSLFQKVIEKTLGLSSPIDVYRDNRDILVRELTALNIECCNPKGAFYLLVRAPGGDSVEFCQRAKQLGLLLVPTDTFGAPGYVRIATCVSTDMVNRSIVYFKQLMSSYSD